MGCYSDGWLARTGSITVWPDRTGWTRGTLTLRSVTLLVLDAADRMLEMGFRPDVEQILVRTPSTRQTALFASTIPDTVRTMVGRYLRNPIYVALTMRETRAIAGE